MVEAIDWLAFLHGLTVALVETKAAFGCLLDEEEEYEEDELDVEEVDEALDRGDMISSLVVVEFIDLNCGLVCC
jgi:hypothetical protein